MIVVQYDRKESIGLVAEPGNAYPQEDPEGESGGPKILPILLKPHGKGVWRFEDLTEDNRTLN